MFCEGGLEAGAALLIRCLLFLVDRLTSGVISFGFLFIFCCFHVMAVSDSGPLNWFSKGILKTKLQLLNAQPRWASEHHLVGPGGSGTVEYLNRVVESHCIYILLYLKMLKNSHKLKNGVL